MQEPFHSLIQNQLSYKLYPVSMRELMQLTKATCDIYTYSENYYHLQIRKEAALNHHYLRDLIAAGKTEFFVYKQEHLTIKEEIQKQLTLVTRSLSVGSAVDNARQQMNLLTIHMSYLYHYPTDDNLLAIQYQCAKNLAYFLIKNINYHEKLYKEFLKQRHHFIYAQPLIASLFTLGMLKFSKKFNDQEIEALFITSYFKDIGMCSLPEATYEKDNLSPDEKELMGTHAKLSVEILRDRLPLSPHHFHIIENHHSFSLLKSNFDIIPRRHADKKVIFGFETVSISVMDIIAAAIHGRPFREPIKVFDALALVKNLIVDKYPQEFKMMVGYFKKFFFDK
jgi:response regulator RpfG family c-di-GMP phosphodiesterase